MVSLDSLWKILSEWQYKVAKLFLRFQNFRTESQKGSLNRPCNKIKFITSILQRKYVIRKKHLFFQLESSKSIAFVMFKYEISLKKMARRNLFTMLFQFCDVIFHFELIKLLPRYRSMQLKYLEIITCFQLFQKISSFQELAKTWLQQKNNK